MVEILTMTFSFIIMVFFMVHYWLILEHKLSKCMIEKQLYFCLDEEKQLPTRPSACQPVDTSFATTCSMATSPQKEVFACSNPVTINPHIKSVSLPVSCSDSVAEEDVGQIVSTPSVCNANSFSTTVTTSLSDQPCVTACLSLTPLPNTDSLAVQPR